MSQEIPATEQEVFDHLDALLTSFVDRDRRERWKLLFMKRPKQAYHELNARGLALIEKRATRVESDADLKAQLSKAERWGRGLRIDFRWEPAWVSVDEVVSGGHSWAADSTILSIVPGRVAVYFQHDGAAWVLRRAD